MILMIQIFHITYLHVYLKICRLYKKYSTYFSSKKVHELKEQLKKQISNPIIEVSHNKFTFKRNWGCKVLR